MNVSIAVTADLERAVISSWSARTMRLFMFWISMRMPTKRPKASRWRQEQYFANTPVKQFDVDSDRG